MATSSLDESQRKAARVVGWMYLLMLATAAVAEFYVPMKIIVPASAAETARNIIASERLFRLGIVCDLITFSGDVILVAALYVLLRPVHRELAFLAALWRLAECSVFGVATLNHLTAILPLSGADYLRAFQTTQLQALSKLSLGAYAAGYNIGLIFFGMGSTIFCYLFLKSGYIPRALATWGVIASLGVLLRSLVIVVFPEYARPTLAPSFLAIGSFEFATGMWLALRGPRHGESRASSTV